LTARPSYSDRSLESSPTGAESYWRACAKTHSVELDAGRLRDLSVFTRAELRPICLGSIGAIAEQFEALDRALAAGQLESAGEVAHSARNEALLVGARELSDALATLESAAREGESARVQKAAELARELWPETRAAISALADHGVTG
jgi:hypothetical protein